MRRSIPVVIVLLLLAAALLRLLVIDSSASPSGGDRELWQRFRVGRPHDSASWPTEHDGPGPTEVHCICGPHDVPSGEQACAPVLENATMFAFPESVVTFFIDLSPLGGAANAIAAWSARRLASTTPGTLDPSRLKLMRAMLERSLADGGSLPADESRRRQLVSQRLLRATYADYRLLDILTRTRSCLRSSALPAPEHQFTLRVLPPQRGLLGVLNGSNAWPLWGQKDLGGDWVPPLPIVNSDAEAALMGGTVPQMCPPSWRVSTAGRRVRNTRAWENAAQVLRDPKSSRAARETALTLVASDFAVVMSRWGGMNLWHLTWDHGLFQIWLFWRRMLLPWLLFDLPSPGVTSSSASSWESQRPETRAAELNATLSQFVTKETNLPSLELPGPMVDIVSDHDSPKQNPGRPANWETTFVENHGRAAVHEWWWIALRPATGFLFNETGRRCRRFNVLLVPRVHVSGRLKIRTDVLSTRLMAHAHEFFHSGILQPLLQRYGDVSVDSRTPLLLEDREPSQDFNVNDGRSRGIQFYLRDEIIRALWPLVAAPSSPLLATGSMNRSMSHRLARFGYGTPMRDQLHAIRRATVVICGEGAFHTLLPLSRAGTTWIVVYNHTRKHDLGDVEQSWKYINFHAPLCRAFPSVRTVFYMIDDGRRDPIVGPTGNVIANSSLLRALFDGRQGSASDGGVYFVGADAHGHRVGTKYP